MERDIQNLIKRFMDGLTSVEEEDKLAEYFRTHDVDEKWRTYKEMFAWFDEGMPHDRRTDKQTKPQKRKITFLLAAVAATVALMLILVRPDIRRQETTCNSPQTAILGKDMTMSTVDTLPPDTATVDEPKKKTRRRGLRRDTYKPLPPKVYIAENIQDTISDETKMLAEKKIREAEERQQKMLNDILNEYRRIEAGIDLYITALENYDIEEEYY